MLRRLTIWFFISTVLVLGVLLGVFNRDAVTIDLIAMQFDWPLAAVIAASMAVGMLLGAMVSLLLGTLPEKFGRRRSQKQVREHERQQALSLPEDQRP